MTESSYAKRATLAVATDVSMSLQLRKDGSETQAAAIELIQPVVAANPAVIEAGATAAAAQVEAKIEAEGLIRGVDPRVAQANDVATLLYAVTDANGNRTWLEVSAADGGLTDFALEMLNRRAPQAKIGDVAGMIYALTDAAGYRTWLEVRQSDGGPSDLTISMLASRLGLDGAGTTSFVAADGDSMTQGGHGTGASWPSLLSDLTGQTVLNRGLSGTTASEIAIRTGVVQLLTIPGGAIPADTSAVTVTIANPGPWSGSDQSVRVYSGTVRGVPVTLTYTPSTGTWTLARNTAGTAVALASPIAFVPSGPDLVRGATHIIWAGRNNTPKSTTLAQVQAMVARLPVGTRFLVVSITNRASAGIGSTDRNDVIAENLRLQAAYPYEYVDVRGRLIREGLALAGITPTAADTAAIADDRIPPSLMFDDLHPNGAGRLAIAAIMQNELTYRGML